MFQSVPWVLCPFEAVRATGMQPLLAQRTLRRVCCCFVRHVRGEATCRTFFAFSCRPGTNLMVTFPPLAAPPHSRVFAPKRSPPPPAPPPCFQMRQAITTINIRYKTTPTPCAKTATNVLLRLLNAIANGSIAVSNLRKGHDFNKYTTASEFTEFPGRHSCFEKSDQLKHPITTHRQVARAYLKHFLAHFQQKFMNYLEQESAVDVGRPST